MDEAAWASLQRAIVARRRPIMEGLAGFLRLDTVSQNPDGVRACGEWLVQAMKARGLDADLMETGGNPAVYGSLPLPGARRTVLIYCHFDVKPAPSTGWLQPSPFEPVLRRGTAEEGAPILGLRHKPEERADGGLIGLKLDGREGAHHGDGIYLGVTRIGVVTSACLSPHLGVGIAMARVQTGQVSTGGEVEIGSLDQHQKRMLATVVPLPFYDPEKKRPRG